MLYNKYLFLNFNVHICVTICLVVSSAKYIYKYIHKGYNSINVEINGTNSNNEIMYDEVRNYLAARYVSAPEVCGPYSRWKCITGLLEVSVYLSICHKSNLNTLNRVKSDSYLWAQYRKMHHRLFAISWIKKIKVFEPCIIWIFCTVISLISRQLYGRVDKEGLIHLQTVQS